VSALDEERKQKEQVQATPNEVQATLNECLKQKEKRVSALEEERKQKEKLEVEDHERKKHQVPSIDCQSGCSAKRQRSQTYQPVNIKSYGSLFFGYPPFCLQPSLPGHTPVLPPPSINALLPQDLALHHYCTYPVVHISELAPNDVPIGRGAEIRSHKGLMAYSNKVRSLLDDYRGSDSLRRAEIRAELMEFVERTGGRFCVPPEETPDGYKHFRKLDSKVESHRQLIDQKIKQTFSNLL
jgi:hypothetical protein